MLGFTVSSFQSNTKPEYFGNWTIYSANIAGMYDGSLTFNELMQLTLANKIDPPKPRKGCSLNIRSYNFLYFNPKKYQSIYRETVNGNRFTGTMISKLMQAIPGDYIIFENIIGECPKGNKLVKLPPLIFDYNGIKIRAK